MPDYFTHYWNTATCEFQQAGRPLHHTAGNDFAHKHVAPGDYVYVVNILRGRLRIIGRMQVARIVNYDEACELLDYDPWDADEHCLAVPGSATTVRLDRFVPIELVRRLRFARTDNSMVPLAFRDRDADLLDQQTLRAVRRLTPQSAALLDGILDQEQPH
ncbi:MAG: hypothetical protein IPM18_00880 [Phycisphaerales bacterium]|nr:hypothetical protein [Phycisphaerales bacterium]